MAAKAGTYGEAKGAEAGSRVAYGRLERVAGSFLLPSGVTALVAFAAALALSIVDAGILFDGIATGAGEPLAWTGQAVATALSVGFAAVLLAVVVGIVRILAELRVGTGMVEEATGSGAVAPDPPGPARGMVLVMAAAVAAFVFVAAAHLVLGVRVHTGVLEGNGPVLQSWSAWLEGLGRLAMGLSFLSIALGLFAVIRVVHSQGERFETLALEEAAEDISTAHVAAGQPRSPAGRFRHDRILEGWTLVEEARDSGLISGEDIELSPFLEEGAEGLRGAAVVGRVREIAHRLGQQHAEHLLEHQEELPSEFQHCCLIFAGTIWLGSDGRHHVPYLEYREGAWQLGFGVLESGADPNDYLVRARR